MTETQTVPLAPAAPARRNVDAEDLANHVIVLVGYLIGALLTSFGPLLLGWWDTTTTAVLMAVAVGAWLWRDWLTFIKTPEFSFGDRLRAVCRVGIVASMTIALLVLAIFHEWQWLAVSMICILSGVVYRLSCGRMGTLQMEEAAVRRAALQRRYDAQL